MTVCIKKNEYSQSKYNSRSWCLFCCHLNMCKYIKMFCTSVVNTVASAEASMFSIVIVIIFLLFYMHKGPIKTVIILLLCIIYWRNILLFYYFIRILLFKNTRKEIHTIFSTLFTFSHNFEKLPSKQTIFVANYPCMYFDSFATMLVPGNVAMVAADTCKNRCFLDLFVSDMIYSKENGNSYNSVKLQIKRKLNKKCSILAYATTSHGFRTDSKVCLGRIRTGLFRIAQELGASITPIVFDYIDNNFCRIHTQNYRIYVGDTFYVTDPVTDSRRVKKLYNQKLSYFMKYKW